jgi:uncharacterized protein (TIGR00369 family)
VVSAPILPKKQFGIFVIKRRKGSGGFTLSLTRPRLKGCDSHKLPTLDVETVRNKDVAMLVSPEIDLRVRESFALQTFMTTISAEITAVDAGRVVIEAPISETFLQQQGFAHAGLVFTLGDTAAGYAALTTPPQNVEVMTVEMKIKLLLPAAGRLRAQGRVLKAGRRVTVVAADVWAEDLHGKQKHVAVMQGTMISVSQ